MALWFRCVSFVCEFTQWIFLCKQLLLRFHKLKASFTMLTSTWHHCIEFVSMLVAIVHFSMPEGLSTSKLASFIALTSTWHHCLSILINAGCCFGCGFDSSRNCFLVKADVNNASLGNLFGSCDTCLLIALKPKPAFNLDPCQCKRSSKFRRGGGFFRDTAVSQNLSMICGLLHLANGWDVCPFGFTVLLVFG